MDGKICVLFLYVMVLTCAVHGRNLAEKADRNTRFGSELVRDIDAIQSSDIVDSDISIDAARSHGSDRDVADERDVSDGVIVDTQDDITDFILRSLNNETLRERPGFMGRITQKGFDFASSLGTKLLMQELTKISIPDIRHNIGTTEVSVTDVEIVAFPEPRSKLFPIPWPGYGLRWSAYRISPTITAKYKAEMDFALWTITKTGTATFVGENIYFALDFFITSDEDGRPVTEVTQCESNGDIDLDFEGGWSDMMNAGSVLFKNRIRSLITAQICYQAKKEINAKLSEQLRSLPLQHTVANDYLLDLSMKGNPSFDSDAVDVPFKGALYVKEDPEEPPFYPPEIMEHEADTERMIYLYVTDYFLNSAFFSTYRIGLLAYNVTPELLPEEFRHYLNTSCSQDICLGTVFPQLPLLHPGVTVSVEITANAPPRIGLQGNSINVTAQGEADVFVRDENGTKHSLFVIDIDIAGGLTLNFTGQTLYFNVTHIDITCPHASVKESFIGDIGTGFLFESVLRVVSQKVLVPKLGEYGAKGVDLPVVKGIEFMQPIIVDSDMENVMVVGTDIGYQSKRKRVMARKAFWAKRRQQKREQRAQAQAARKAKRAQAQQARVQAKRVRAQRALGQELV